MHVELQMDLALLQRAMKAETEAALLRAALDAETARWEEALRLTWQMVDPLKPAVIASAICSCSPPATRTGTQAFAAPGIERAHGPAWTICTSTICAAGPGLTRLMLAAFTRRRSCWVTTACE